MISFKQYLLERTYNFSALEQESIQKVVQMYMRMFDPKRLNMPMFKIISIGPEKVYREYMNKEGRINIGYVKFRDDRSKKDKEIPVYVGFDKNSIEKGTYVYEEPTETQKEEEYILLHYYKIKYDYDVVEDALEHEVNHAKQPYKTPGKNYNRSKLDYYTDPVEVHNYVSNIIKAIEKEYVESEYPQEVISFIEQFAREGKVPNSPLGDIIKKIGKNEFVEYLYNNRNNPKVAKEHKKLISKLSWLYNHLKEYQNR